jgi:peroxiredoxin 2/4
MAKIGERAPQFTAPAYVNGEFKTVKLEDYKGKWVVLFFWPLDFTFICPTEIRGFAKMEEEFRKNNAVILGASTDSEHSHKAWREQDLKEVNFPLISDMSHAISRDYGVLIEEKGIALRGTFIIDPEGVLQYSVISNLNVGRSVDETLRALKAFQTGDLCPVEWEPGEKTLGKA